MLKSIHFSLNGLEVLFKFVTFLYSHDEIIKLIKYKDLHNQGHTLSFTLPYNVHLEIRQIASKHTRYALGSSSHNDSKSVFYKKEKEKQKQKALESCLSKSLFLNSY